MAPEEIKERMQGAYRMAMENRSVQMLREPGVNRLFRDVRLYGRGAETDFAATDLERPVQEAVAMAECRQAALDLPGKDTAGPPSKRWRRRCATSPP